MIYFMVCLDDGSATKLPEEPTADDFDQSFQHLKVEGDKLFTMDEDGNWDEVK